MDKETLVYVDLDGTPHLMGRLWARVRTNKESATFEYDDGWLKHPARFSLEPALQLGPGPFHTPADTPMFGAIGDSAPDRWGRALMRRMERRRAEREGTAPRTLQEIDFLLLVDDEARQGALRFAEEAGGPFLRKEGVKRIPPLVELPKLLSAAEHVMEDKDTEDDLRLLFAPGSSLGGARPKASVIEKDGHLAIAKFPRKDDEINTVVWEAVALALASKAGITVPEARVESISKKPVLLLRRFDREGKRHSLSLGDEHARIEKSGNTKLSGNCRRNPPARRRAQGRHGSAMAEGGVQYSDFQYGRPHAQSRVSLRGAGWMAPVAGIRYEPCADRHQAAHPQHGDQRG
jgi:serine/threonine-protein kinase HipA